VNFGTTVGTTVLSGAAEYVLGGTVSNTNISSGGIAVVSGGGSAGATELDGGYELVASGGIVSGATISAGTLEVASGGAMAGPSEVAFAGSGTLQLDGGTGFGSMYPTKPGPIRDIASSFVGVRLPL
jgi:fibronectin-binding autotransporter adhesin